jgi:hypothetical protein
VDGLEALTHRGQAAAAEDLPHIIGTRDGMRPLEYIAFDDVELDFLVMVAGVPQPAKLRAIIAKDVACDLALAFVLRPALEREDGTQDSLKARDGAPLSSQEALKLNGRATPEGLPLNSSQPQGFKLKEAIKGYTLPGDKP